MKAPGLKNARCNLTAGGASPVRGRNAAFSPDDSEIVFWADQQLKRVVVSGGSPFVLCDAGNPLGLRWESDGTIWYGQGARGIWRVPATGGTPEQVVALGDRQAAHGPQPLPGGEWLLFTLLDDAVAWDDARIVIRSLETGEQRDLIARGRDAHYVSTGHLVYAVDADLLAVRFDVATLKVAGSPVPVRDGVLSSHNITDVAQFAVSDTGTLVTIPGTGLRPSERALVWLDREGNVEPLSFEPRSLDSVA